jgi:hypothetical protein
MSFHLATASPRRRTPRSPRPDGGAE